MIGWVGKWELLAPRGLTETGRIRQFQNRTVERLGLVAYEHAAYTLQELRAAVEAAYTQGSGEVADSLDYRITATRDGIQVEFLVGTNHIVFLTALAGRPYRSPGHVIRAKSTRTLRFFWKSPTGGGAPGVYAFRQVHWRTRAGRDVISDVLSEHAQQFQRAMIAAHDDAFAQFAQNELQLKTRSTRVGVSAGSGIPPQ